MFNTKDVVTRLHNGETTDEIAKEMTDKFNEAINLYLKEKKEQAEAKENAEKHREKMMELQMILDMAREFCLDYYCESEEDANIIFDTFNAFDAEAVNKIINAIGVYAVKLSELEKRFGNIFDSVFENPDKKEPSPEGRTAEIIIGDFLTSLGLN